MKSRDQDFLLGALAFAVIYTASTDHYLRFVKSGLRPYLIIGGLFVLALAISNRVMEERAQRRAKRGRARFGNKRDTRPVIEPVHDHEHGPGASVLLVLPIIVLLVVNPPALGAWAATRNTNASTSAPAEDFEPLPAGQTLTMPLRSYADYAVADTTHSLEGRTVRLTGFSAPKADGSWYLTRLELGCCAADAWAVQVLVLDAPAPAKEKWVQVTGTWAPSDDSQTEDGIAVLKAEQIVEINAPKDPYDRPTDSPTAI